MCDSLLLRSKLSLEVQVLRDALAKRSQRAAAEASTLRSQVDTLKSELGQAAEELRAAHREHAQVVKEQLVNEAHMASAVPIPQSGEHEDDTDGDDTDYEDGAHKRAAELEAQVYAWRC